MIPGASHVCRRPGEGRQVALGHKRLGEVTGRGVVRVTHHGQPPGAERRRLDRHELDAAQNRILLPAHDRHADDAVGAWPNLSLNDARYLSSAADVERVDGRKCILARIVEGHVEHPVRHRREVRLEEMEPHAIRLLRVKSGKREAVGFRRSPLVAEELRLVDGVRSLFRYGILRYGGKRLGGIPERAFFVPHAERRVAHPPVRRLARPVRGKVDTQRIRETPPDAPAGLPGRPGTRFAPESSARAVPPRRAGGHRPVQHAERGHRRRKRRDGPIFRILALDLVGELGMARLRHHVDAVGEFHEPRLRHIPGHRLVGARKHLDAAQYRVLGVFGQGDLEPPVSIRARGEVRVDRRERHVPARLRDGPCASLDAVRQDVDLPRSSFVRCEAPRLDGVEADFILGVRREVREHQRDPVLAGIANLIAVRAVERFKAQIRTIQAVDGLPGRDCHASIGRNERGIGRHEPPARGRRLSDVQRVPHARSIFQIRPHRARHRAETVRGDDPVFRPRVCRRRNGQ